MHYTYTTQGVCPKLIEFDLNGDIVTNIKFTGGCNGNLKMIAKLLDGTSVQYITETLRGNTCGSKFTSCADQLAKAVQKAYDESRA